MASLTLDRGEATNGVNKIGFKGTAELPESHPRVRPVRRQVRDQRRAAGFAIAHRAFCPAVHRHAPRSTGTAEISDAVLRADLVLSGGPIAYGDSERRAGQRHDQSEQGDAAREREAKCITPICVPRFTPR